MPLIKGTQLGPYSIMALLGVGGMGEVYRARDPRLDREVAVKILPPDLAGDRARLERFEREAKALASLNHPNIVTIYSVEEAGSLKFLTMELVEGQTLEQLLPSSGLEIGRLIAVFESVADALVAAHDRGIVHRDLKPANVMVSDENVVKILDFGLAKKAMASGAVVSADLDDLETMSQSLDGQIVGTLPYMSPEQLTGRDVGFSADLFSLGIMMFEGCAGRRPFSGESVAELISSILRDSPPRLDELRPDVPRELATQISRCLDKRPDARPPSARALRDGLSRLHFSPPAVAERGAVSNPSNLPRPRSTFVGRTGEVEAVREGLERSRLLTVCGIGGSGKTRLAIEAATQLLPRFPDGVWFVDLAPLKSDAPVAPAVAAVLGVNQSEPELLEELCGYVRGKRMLIVLDNCEHVLSGCGDVVDRLLASDRDIRLLATSREALAVEGEQQLALRSLALPQSTTPDLQSAEASEAVQLFVDRAHAVGSGLVLDPSNAASVVEVCRRLDGIPLAIELAAARLKILSVDQILARLDDRFRLLSGGGRTALPRHQTLRATLRWSYDLLEPAEQEMLRLLSVFAGGWGLELAAEVAQLDEFDVMDTLEALVAKSLVVVESSGAESRYRYLETVRQFAGELLEEAAESRAAQRRHMDVYLKLAERAYEARHVDEQTWAPLLELEHDNLRAALGVASDADSSRYLRLAGALGWFWIAHSLYISEGHGHLTAALESDGGRERADVRARALWGAANSSAWMGDAAGGLPMMEEAVGLWREADEPQEVALALEGLGMTRFMAGDDHTARDACEESLEIQKESGDPVLINRASIALAQVLVGLHDLDRAHAVASEILEYARRIGDRRSEHLALHYLADCDLIKGNCDRSLQLYDQSLALAEVLEDPMRAAAELQGLAMSLCGLGELVAGLRLSAASEAEWDRLKVDIQMNFWNALRSRYLDGAREELSADRVREAESLGSSMSLAAACEAAHELARRARG